MSLGLPSGNRRSALDAEGGCRSRRTTETPYSRHERQRAESAGLEVPWSTGNPGHNPRLRGKPAHIRHKRAGHAQGDRRAPDASPAVGPAQRPEVTRRRCVTYDPGCLLPKRRVLQRTHLRVLATRGPLAASDDELRPTGAAGAALTEMGRVSPGLHVTVQAAPFMRKSSVWVAHSCIGPGRSSLVTEAAARRSHLSTRHITGDSAVMPRTDDPPTMPMQPAVPRRLASYDPAPDLFLGLFLAPLLFERLRRLLGHRLAGRLVCHVYPLS